MGFAIPVDVVRSSVGQIISTGKVVKPVLGISFAPDAASEQLGVKGRPCCVRCCGCAGGCMRLLHVCLVRVMLQRLALWCDGEVQGGGRW